MKQKGKLLPPAWFESTDVLFLARDLLGKFLCTRINGQLTSGMIVETEAYRGPDDRACHAYNYRRTARTEVMFGNGGHAYVYICYGMHHLMNVVTAPAEHAHAILIRALEPVDGIDIMAERRNMRSEDTRLTKGPGALSVALALQKNLTGSPLFTRTSPVWIEDRGITFPDAAVCAGKRIGVEGAGESAHLPWRFFVKESRYVSAHKKCG